MTLSPTIRWRTNRPHVVHEILDDEVVVINLDTGSYYSLSGVGTDVWASIETGATTDEIVQRISRRYGGSSVEMEQAVVRLIEELRREDLIAADETHAVEHTTTLGELDDTKLEKRDFEAPVLQKYTDMQELLVLDPVHEVDETGWPTPRRTSN